VTLEPKLTLPMGAALTLRLRGTHPDLPAVQGDLMAGYLAPAPVGGIVGWSFLNDKGEPEPVNEDNITRLIPWANGGMEVAEKADELYAADLLAPFVKRASTLLAGGLTDDSTSATPSPGPNTPTPLPRSSPPKSAGKRSGAQGRSHGRKAS
jgi:hypothetical protein